MTGMEEHPSRSSVSEADFSNLYDLFIGGAGSQGREKVFGERGRERELNEIWHIQFLRGRLRLLSSFPFPSSLAFAYAKFASPPLHVLRRSSGKLSLPHFFGQGGHSNSF